MGAQVPRVLPAQLPIRVQQVAQVPLGPLEILLQAQQVLEKRAQRDIEDQRGMQALVVVKA